MRNAARSEEAIIQIVIQALAAAILVGAGGASAQALDCRNASSQTDINICAGQAFRKSDAALNRSYATVMSRLSPIGKAALRDAQRAWVAFRDQECAFESNSYGGGSAASISASGCAQTLTDQRAKTLAQFRACVEGDISCPR